MRPSPVWSEARRPRDKLRASERRGALDTVDANGTIERLRLQDRVIDLLNDQLRDCREKAEGLERHLAEAFQRLQVEADLRRVRETDLAEAAQRWSQEAREAQSARDQERERLLGELAASRAETAALRRTWSWRLTRVLRILPRA